MTCERIKRNHFAKIKYSGRDWELLKKKRKSANDLLNVFNRFNPYVYGSVARGNVHENSDIDIVFLKKVPIFKIEFYLYQHNIKRYHREIIMATPHSSIKLYLHLNEFQSLTIPLTKLDLSEEQFFDFGGKINLQQLNSNLRVPGVDKRLVFIQPTPSGHEEFSLINNESLVAKKLEIDIKTVIERRDVLLRRENYGRTGVFLKRQLMANESPTEVLETLAKNNHMVRNKLLEN